MRSVCDSKEDGEMSLFLINLVMLAHKTTRRRVREQLVNEHVP